MAQTARQTSGFLQRLPILNRLGRGAPDAPDEAQKTEEKQKDGPKGSVPRLKHLADLPADGKAVIVHSGPYWTPRVAAGQVSFIEKLAARSRQEGVPFTFLPIGDPQTEASFDRAAHHIMLGPRKPYQNNVLHAYPGPVWGFWYFDPDGVLWLARQRQAPFDPAQVDRDAARHFFYGVSSYMKRKGLSRIETRPRAAQPLPAANALIVMQDIENDPAPVHYLTTRQMIRHTANACDALVYVKPPHDISADARAELDALCAEHENLRVSSANIHDLIAASRMVISQNSPAGLDAMMHKKPVLTCAAADYHHGALVCHDARELRANIAAARRHFETFPFERYFYWYLHDFMLEPGKPDFADKAWQRLMAPRG